ncbi:MAG: (2Fe-2S)-binding protein [Alkaliphilus sp.]
MKAELRIKNHPILDFEKEKILRFIFEEKDYEGYEGETIAVALHAAGVKVLGRSEVKNRPRGFYCAIGNCSSCLMIVNGEPNVRTCVVQLEEGMKIERQEGKGEILWKL